MEIEKIIKSADIPCYVMEEDLLRKNLTLIKSVAERAGVEIILAFKAKFLKRILRCVFLPNRKAITHAQERPCEIMVASAAPLTPILNPNINIGSSTILATAPIRTDSIPVFAKPCAVIKAFIPRVSCTNMVPMAYIFI